MNNPGFRFAPRSSFTLFAAAGVCGVLLGCPFTNENHCSLNQGACGEGLVCSMCAADNNGCVAPDVLQSDCQFAGPSTSTSDPVTSTSDPTSTTSSDTSTSTTGPTVTPTTEDTTIDVTVTSSETGSTTTTSTDPDTGSTATTSEIECDPEFGNDMCASPTPYCVDFECVSCTEKPCSELDPPKEACDDQTGLCVECIDNDDCGGSTPYCNPDSATCEPCSMHEHCPGTACILDDGVCFPGDNVIWVDNTPGSCNNLGPGTEDMPICLLSYALAKAAPGDPLTVKVRAGTGMQNESLFVNTAVDVAIVSAKTQKIVFTRSGPEDALDISGGARVYLHKFTFFNPMVGQTNYMLDCSAGTLWLDEVTVYNAKVGVRTNNCVTHMRRAVVHETSMGGVLVTNQSKLWMENSFVNKNGPTHGLSITTNSSAEVLYSTFAANAGIAAPIACTNTNATISVRNSVIADGNEKYTTCNLTEDEGNLRVNLATTAALISMGFAASYQEGVLRAQKDGGFKDIAIWHMGDTRNDFDTVNIRPSMEGAVDYVGADVP